MIVFRPATFARLGGRLFVPEDSDGLDLALGGVFFVPPPPPPPKVSLFGKRISKAFEIPLTRSPATSLLLS